MSSIHIDMERLYQTLGPMVFRRCLKLLRNRELARDATQEVFIKILRHRERLQNLPDALPWVYCVATHQCLNVRRNEARMQRALSSLPVGEGVLSDTFPEQQLSQKVLSKFDQTTQAIAVGVLVDGMEHEELAQMLDVSARTVARKLQRFLSGACKVIARSVS